MSRMDPGEFLETVVWPALYAGLDAAFPEFGWRRRSKGWEATDNDYTHGALGARADRVFCHPPSPGRPFGFGVAGGNGMTWTAYVSGGKEPRQRQRMDAIKRLAEAAGVDASALGKPLSEADRAAMEARRQELERLAEERQAQSAVEREALVLAAQEVFAFAEPFGQGIAEGYARARGIDLAALPGGVLPPSIRSMPWPKKVRVKYPPAEGGVLEVLGPVVLAACVREGRVTGVQRIYLDIDEPTAKRAERAKLGMGVLEGAACPLGSHGEPRRIALTEGVETGWAVLSAGAPGVAVYACISTSGLVTFEPDWAPEEIDIMGDHDELVRPKMGDPHRPGERAARNAAARLVARCPVRVCVPDGGLVPEMVGPDGQALV